METTKDVQDANAIDLDMLFVIVGCLVKRLGGTVQIPIEEIKDLNGGFVTDAGPDGIGLTMVDEIPKDTVLVQ